ncbi:AAA family ATPase [Virgibacillus flavescens]|uniref:AAA family ATPase n=1 Tax=Virgibacillus flavescens TaxID=1611422 RepID=UPI003D3472F4
MKRLAIITVGKTHSGKTTFARALEKKLKNSIVVDQDNHAEFLNTYYNNLAPKQGPNTLKHDISKLIVNYAADNTDFHIIISNSNRHRKDRLYLLDEFFNKNNFIRILVHFDIPYTVLQNRVTQSQRSTNIFRNASLNFEEVLVRQESDVVSAPTRDEADHLCVINNNEEVDTVMQRIVDIADFIN